jgi:GNAT superfamily N-acetyltransferase
LKESDIVVRKLSPDMLDDFLAFFDRDAFTDNPDWAFCYCQCFYLDHSKIVWKDQTAEENRARAQELIPSGGMQGYLAYIEDRPVGWCNAAPWSMLKALHDEPCLMADKTGVITCFVVSEPYRGQGVATALLQAACDGLRDEGLEYAEAYAKADAEGPAENHSGPQSMYLAAGFEIQDTDDDGMVTVRKRLVS